MAQTRSRIPGNHSFSSKWREKPSSCQCLASNSFGSTEHAPGASWSTRSGDGEQNRRTPEATMKIGPWAHVLCVYSLSSSQLPFSFREIPESQDHAELHWTEQALCTCIITNARLSVWSSEWFGSSWDDLHQFLPPLPNREQSVKPSKHNKGDFPWGVVPQSPQCIHLLMLQQNVSRTGGPSRALTARGEGVGSEVPFHPYWGTYQNSSSSAYF